LDPYFWVEKLGKSKKGGKIGNGKGGVGQKEGIGNQKVNSVLDSLEGKGNRGDRWKKSKNRQGRKER